MAKKSVKTVSVKSSEGEEFVIPVSTAQVSVTIKELMEERDTTLCFGGRRRWRVIPLPGIDRETLTAIIPFMYRYAAAETDMEKAITASEFVSGMEREDIYHFMMMAHYLRIDDLTLAAAAKTPVWANSRVWSYHFM